MTKIICINGFKRSGKGETGKAIVSVAQDHCRHAVTLGFADKLKVAACRNLGLLGLSDEDAIAYMDAFKEAGYINYGITTDGVGLRKLHGRKYLQWMGTEYRTLFGAGFWVDQVLPKVPGLKIANSDPDRLRRNEITADLKARYPGADIVAFTDCRFANEAQRVLDLSGEVWEVIHPKAESDGHDSEQTLPRELVTRQIINDGTLMDLRYKVEKALAL